tara:strand:- start:26 stop:367 length:342 start_codon:yes stop_codon:yes gene_type:complete
LKNTPINIIYLFLILFIACGEKLEIHISKTVQFEGKIYLLESDDPFTGILFNEYSNGQREYEGSYKKGTPNGKLTYYFENGSKMREGNIKNGSPAGRWTYYNSDGSIKEIKDQ